MQKARISFRRCRSADLLPAVQLILKSINALRRRTGMPTWRRRFRAAPPLFKHLHARDPKSFYCAFRGARMVGFAGAIHRGRHWYLGWLFVHPGYQDRGIGRRLLSKVWVPGPQISHSVSTFGTNMQPISLYSRFGMLPDTPLLMMRCKRAALIRRMPPPTDMELVLARRSDLAWINALEKEIRGFPHAPEWRYWYDRDDFRIVVLRRRGRRIGYSMVNTAGEIAPIGVVKRSDMIPVATAMLREAAAQPFGKTPAEYLQVTCPLSNRILYDFLLAAGFRNEEMLLFMSEQPYADFSRYIPANLALF
jgi:GNAT superfamily N-acetyltransferase